MINKCLQCSRLVFPNHEDVIEKSEPQAGHWELLSSDFVKELIFKLCHVQVGKGWGASSAHSHSTSLAIDMAGKLKEVVL